MTYRETSTQQPRIQQSLPHLELSREYMSEELETEQPLQTNLDPVEDQGSVAKPHVEYQLFGRLVTQEEWKQYNDEQRRREEEAGDKRNMEREERIPEEHEA